MDEARIKYGQPRGIFSQLDEDLFLSKYFNGKRIVRGSFLDVGAYDGVLYSNTRYFAMNGWSGVCVEASSPCFAELSRLYPPTNKTVVCLHAAVTTDVDGEIEIHETADPVSTTVDFNREKFSSLSTFTAAKVRAVSMSALAKEFPGPYDLISIDTEGTSFDLALCIPIEILTPDGVICVEQDLDIDSFLDGMKLKGFRPLYDNGLNVLLVRSSES